MTEPKAMKNIFSLSLAFMFVFTAFVSLQGLQSTLNPEGGVGVVSISVIYGSTVLSCLLAPWLINRLTTKWTMVLAFSLYFCYFAANFYPKHYLLIPLSVMLGALAGPMWSAQATYVTTLALTFAQHRRFAESSDDTINKFMGIFFGFFRSSQIWGNLISALVLGKNYTEDAGLLLDSRVSSQDGHHLPFFLEGQEIVNGGFNISSSVRPGMLKDSSHHRRPGGLPPPPWTSSLSSTSAAPYFSLLLTSPNNVSESLCGVSTCPLNRSAADGFYSNAMLGAGGSASAGGVAFVPDATKYMLLTTYLACGLMGMVIVVALVDQVHVGKRSADPEFSLTSFELFASTLKMLRDSKCCLLVPLVVFMGLEQGFMFSDFTKVSGSAVGRGWMSTGLSGERLA